MIAIQTIDVLIIQIVIFYGFILAGYLVARLSRKGQVANKYLSSLLINILVPILVFYALLTPTPISLSFNEIVLFIVIAIVIHLLGPSLLYLRFRRVEMENQTKGALYLCSTFTNALFVPLPLALIFLGSIAMPFVILFSLTQMVLLVSIGSLIGSTFSEKETGPKRIVEDMITFPPLLAAILSLILIGLNVRLPEDIALILSLNSPLTTYLALVSVGLGIGISFSLTNIRTSLNVVAVRQLIVPLLVIPLVLLSTLPTVPLQVLFLEALMPPAILTVVYASEFDLNVEIAATTVTIGTLLLLLLIPILLLLFG
ncbi:MAG: AEC family transporter [Candidatus Thorarchaeota archaeon]